MYIDIALYNNISANSFRESQKIKWSELVNALKKPLKKATKYQRGVVLFGTVAEGGYRNNENVISRSALVLDYDNITVDTDFNKLISDQIKYSYIIHSTYNHSKSDKRYRLIIPCNTPISPDVYSYAVKNLANGLNIEGYDPQSEIASQVMALPCVKDNGETYEFYYQEGDYMESKIFQKHYDQSIKQDKGHRGAFLSNEWLDYLKPLSEGEGRNTSLTKLLGHLLAHNVNVNVAYYLLRAWNNEHNIPLNIKEFDKTFNSILKINRYKESKKEGYYES